MKNKILLAALAALLFMPRTARAETLEDYVYLGDYSKSQPATITLVDSLGLAYDYESVVDFGARNSNSLSAVTTFSSATYAAVSVTSGSFTAASANISAPTHGLVTGLAVLFAQGSGTAPVPLVDQTTYYISYVASADVISLATTSAQAVLADPITIVSKTAGNDETYTITPLAITGSPVFTWTVSNDNLDYANFTTAVSSTITGSYTAAGASYALNFADMNYRFLKYSVTSPTQGALDLKTIIHVK